MRNASRWNLARFAWLVFGPVLGTASCSGDDLPAFPGSGGFGLAGATSTGSNPAKSGGNAGSTDRAIQLVAGSTNGGSTAVTNGDGGLAGVAGTGVAGVAGGPFDWGGAGGMLASGSGNETISGGMTNTLGGTVSSSGGSSGSDGGVSGTSGGIPTTNGGASTQTVLGGAGGTASSGFDLAGSNNGVAGMPIELAGSAGISNQGGTTNVGSTTSTGGVATGGAAAGGVATGGVATGGAATGGAATGGAATGGAATGGAATGGAATGGAATGGAATGGAATGGAATGGAATGGAATGGTTACTSSPTSKLCGGSCVDVATHPQNCKVCGHDCGYGSSCIGAQCQPVVVHTSPEAITGFEVDQSIILFSLTAPGIFSCDLTGCALGASAVSTYSPGADRFLANGYVLVEHPSNSPTGLFTAYGLCPTAGCTTSNMIAFEENNKQVTIYQLTASAHNFYESLKAPPGTILTVCAAPAGTACAPKSSTQSVSLMSSLPLIATDTTLYFYASDSTLNACNVPDLGTCTPTPVNLPTSPAPQILGAYGEDLYFYLPGGPPPNTAPTLRKCPRTGCSGVGTSLGVVGSGVPGEAEIDASGVYWISGNSVKMCPLSGCVGAPVDVTTNAPNATMLRLNSNFVYWVNSNDYTINRVAKLAM